MNMHLYDILPRLQPYIKVICSIENNGNGDALSPFRVLPDTCVELFVNYVNAGQMITAGAVTVKQPQSFITSRMSRYMDVHQAEKSGFIAICFLPGAATHFFGHPMNEIANSVIGLTDLWNNTAKEMEERVAEADTNSQRVTIIQQYLINQLASLQERDKIVEHWMWQVNFFKGQLPVEQLSRKVNLSQRQLARRFNHSIGLSPKEFTRVTRFIHSLKHLRKYPSISLTEVAYESGYYDQAHFIHDYKEYTGYAPGELLASANILY
jgi:AraC-like DNA-binding protein